MNLAPRVLHSRRLLYAGYFLNGVIAVLLGPLIPELEARWGIAHSQSAYLFPAQFAASSLAATVSTFHLKRSQVLGYALMAIGLLVLVASDWPLALFAVALTGSGIGLTIPSTNLIVARWNPDARGASLATLNTLWGIGAVSSPLLFAVFRNRLEVSTILQALAVLAGILAVLLAARLHVTGSSSPSLSTAESILPPPKIMLALLALTLFLYVGIENTLGGWLVTLSDQLTAQRTTLSLVIGSGFWGALVVGRASSALALRRFDEATLYRICLVVAGSGVAALLLVPSRWGLALGALVAGIGLGPLFPLTISMLAAATASSGSRHTGWIFAIGGLGGGFLPWLTGQLINSTASPRGSFLVPLASLVLLTAVVAVYQRLATRR